MFIIPPTNINKFRIIFFIHLIQSVDITLCNSLTPQINSRFEPWTGANLSFFTKTLVSTIPETEKSNGVISHDQAGQSVVSRFPIHDLLMEVVANSFLNQLDLCVGEHRFVAKWDKYFRTKNYPVAQENHFLQHIRTIPIV